MNKSPLHFKYHVDHIEGPTKALIFGQLTHKLILEHEDFNNDFAVSPTFDRRTKAGKEEAQKFAEENAGKTVVSEDDYNIASEMMKAVYANETAAELLNNGEHEISFEWTDPDTGEECKCRADCVSVLDGIPYIVDYKIKDAEGCMVELYVDGDVRFGKSKVGGVRIRAYEGARCAQCGKMIKPAWGKTVPELIDISKRNLGNVCCADCMKKEKAKQEKK